MLVRLGTPVAYSYNKHRIIATAVVLPTISAEDTKYTWLSIPCARVAYAAATTGM